MDINKMIKDAYSNIELPESAKQQGLDNFMRAYDSSISGKEDIIMSKSTKKIKRPFVTAATIAAAAMLTITAGATAVKYFFNRDSLNVYYEESTVDKLESMGLVNGLSKENEHIRFTIDTLVCDGNRFDGVFTITALDNEAKKIINEENYAAVCDVYAADAEDETMSREGYVFEQKYREDEISFTMGFMLNNYHGNYDELILTPIFGSSESEKSDKYDDLSITVSIKPNTEPTVLVSEDGDEIYLNPISCYQSGKGRFIEGGKGTYFSSYLILPDGSKELIFDAGGAPENLNGKSNTFGLFFPEYDEENTDYFGIYFGKVIDVDDYAGIEFNGIRYMKK